MITASKTRNALLAPFRLLRNILCSCACNCDASCCQISPYDDEFDCMDTTSEFGASELGRSNSGRSI